MRYFSFIAVLFLFSCGNKEDLLLPKSDATIVKEVLDHSPIYIFFRIKESDTLAEVNRKNSIITTNWIFNIDKRLPLRLVIPEVVKLQNKKRNEVAHRNEKAENYYSYADTIGMNLAFMPFTKVYYKLASPAPVYNTIYFEKDIIKVNNVPVTRPELKDYLNKMFLENPGSFKLSFNKNETYGSYIQNKVFIRKLVLKNKRIRFDENQEFIY